METAVMAPSPAIDFNFDSSCTSPYMSAPSSPPRFGTPFFSAPTSPTHRISSSSAPALYITSASIATSLSAVPFNWEDKPGLPKSSTQPNENDENVTNKDFAFDFSGQLDKHYLPADELFDGGKIKPLKPPPCVNYENSPKSPRSPKKTFKETFSPRSSKRRDFDPFAQAFKNTSMEESQTGGPFQRGRERKSSNFDSFNTTTTPISSRHNKTRSLSPFRVSDLLFDQETEHHQQQQQQKTDKPSNSTSSWYKKWKIKDLLLFRSASEGRPSSKAQLKKYAVLKKTNNNNTTNNISPDDDDDSKNMSFRSVDSSVGSSSSSATNTCSKRRSSGLISAHELHYTINRAVSEEMKKKTFLPYKQGLLGCLGFQPAAATDISRGVGSMSRGGL